jgi:hypothetical protein
MCFIWGREPTMEESGRAIIAIRRYNRRQFNLDKGLYEEANKHNYESDSCEEQEPAEPD